MEAAYIGFLGQAFTSAAGVFSGTREEVLNLPLEDAFNRAVLVSTINAVLRNLGIVEGTVHCRDAGPADCAAALRRWVKEEGADRVDIVGTQPALLSALVEVLGPERMIVSDLTCAGEVGSGVRVLDGLSSELLFERYHLVLITGTTLANGTIDGILEMADRFGCRSYSTALPSPGRLIFWGSKVGALAPSSFFIRTSDNVKSNF